MFKGFYNLTSAMLTHQQDLNVIGNNLVNISTPGYKQSKYTATTFDDVLYQRVGNKDMQGSPIGRQSYIRAASDIVVDHRQGTFEPTGVPLDFAIQGEGFFAIEQADGGRAYIRAGGFSLDEEGYLCLPGYGRVLDPENRPIYLGTDRIHGKGDNIIYYEDDTPIAQLGVFRFENTEELEPNEKGLFVGGGEPEAIPDPVVHNGYLERANTDVAKQMADMIATERAFQSAAQISKMYDQLMSKAANELGRL